MGKGPLTGACREDAGCQQCVGTPSSSWQSGTPIGAPRGPIAGKSRINRMNGGLFSFQFAQKTKKAPKMDKSARFCMLAKAAPTSWEAEEELLTTEKRKLHIIRKRYLIKYNSERCSRTGAADSPVLLLRQIPRVSTTSGTAVSHGRPRCFSFANSRRHFAKITQIKAEINHLRASAGVGRRDQRRLERNEHVHSAST